MSVLSTLKDLKTFAKGIFCERDGTPSSTRVLMYIFAFFSINLLGRIFSHIYRITDTTQLTIWLSNMPLLITALMGLIALPYTINKGAGAVSETFSGLANMMASAKQVQTNTNLEGKLTDLVKKAQGQNNASSSTTPTTPTPMPNVQVGSSGPKG